MLTSLATTLYLPRRESASVLVSTVPGATKGASTIAARDRLSSGLRMMCFFAIQNKNIKNTCFEGGGEESVYWYWYQKK